MTGNADASQGKLTEDIRRRALDLIDSASTMTLATCGGDSVWAAPVYYLYLADRFFFFSKPDSRHIQEALGTGIAAAAIHASAKSWQDIRGLQMSGTIQVSGVGLNTISAVKAYLTKFPFTREFFKDDQQMDLNDFITRFKVKLYYFKPERVYYQDNRIRFGFREEIRLEMA